MDRIEYRTKGIVTDIEKRRTSTLSSNPLETAPCSPSQIYLNLLILEASLRSQYLHHLSRRRKFTFFLVLLCFWTVYFLYRFFVLGGSPYYYISQFEKLGLGGGLVTGVLYYATGLYHKTIVEPRRYVSVANRGLRGFNVKLVKIPLSSREWIAWWWGWYFLKPPEKQINPPKSRRTISRTKRHPRTDSSEAVPYSLPSIASKQPFSPLQEKDEPEEEIEEFLPGGLHIKLVILPKGFSPDFRECWEVYRAEYWEKENEARQSRLSKIKAMYRLKNHTSRDYEKRKYQSSHGRSLSLHNSRTPVSESDNPLGVRGRKYSTTSSKPRSFTSIVNIGSNSDASDSGSAASTVGTTPLRGFAGRTEKSSSSASSTIETSRHSCGGKRVRRRNERNHTVRVDNGDDAKQHGS